MKIELSKDQLKTLLTIMYCGEWMLNSYKTRDDRMSQETHKLEQYIFSIAKETGFEKWIEYDEDMDEYFPTADMEDDLHIFVDKYNERQ